MTLPEYLTIDRSLIHALTGPVFIRGAEPGDVLQVDVLEVAHKGWGWTSVAEGLGFLKQRLHDSFSLATGTRDQPIAVTRDGSSSPFLRNHGRR